MAATGGEGLCLHFDGELRPVRFGPGPHVVSSDRDLDDPELPEKRLFDELLAAGPPDDDALRTYLSSHVGGRPVCKHGDRFGTVSSTIYREGPGGRRLLHAEGPPCRAAFADLTRALGAP